MKIRAAAMEDARMLFDWRNDLRTRAMSIDSEPVEWSDHIGWLERRLGGEHAHLYIAELDGVAVGTFRLDGDTISYTVAPDLRGKGLATRMLRLAHELFGTKRAEIKRGNDASARAAEKAGHKVFWL